MRFKSAFAVFLCFLAFSTQLIANSLEVFPVKDRVFQRASGSPFIDVEEFNKHAYEADYTIQVHNGGYSGEYELVEYSEVSSARVWLNGELIFAPKDFNKAVTYLEKPISLLDVNKLEVEVASQPGSALIINVVGIVHNSPPSIVSAPVISVNERVNYAYQLIVDDIDVNDSHTYSLIVGPQGMNISNAGLIEWQTSTTDIGNHEVSVQVSDVGGLTDTQNFSVSVFDVPDAPVITSTPAENTLEDEPYLYEVLVSDDDVNDTFSIELLSSPEGMTLNERSLIWLPENKDVGNHDILIKVTDSGGLSDEQSFTLVVENVNDAPIITSVPEESAITGVQYTYQIIATDEDLDEITYSIVESPSEVKLDEQSGLLEWLPLNEGTFNFKVTVSDSVEEVIQEFNVFVENNTDYLPIFTSTPITTAKVNQPYIYDVNAEDPNGNEISFALQDAPEGMVIDELTGEVTWVSTSEGGYPVAIVITNSLGLQQSQSFIINVTSEEPNHEGSDFWLTFARNHSGSDELRLYISGKEETTGVVEAASGEFSFEFNVVPGQITQVDVPNTFWTDYTGKAQNRGIHVYSESNIVLYALNQATYTTDGFLVMPTETLGKNYYAMTYNKGQITLLAPHDETEVTITFSDDVSVYNNGNQERYKAGEQITSTLNKGQSYSINTFEGTYSGTKISATKPVATFTGNNCVNVPTRYGACDHIVEHIPDVSYWGMEYSFIPLSLRHKGDTVRIVAAYDNTVVRINEKIITTLDKGEFLDDIIEEPSQISANHPILVAQFSNGETYDRNERGGDRVGDPFMMLLTAQRSFVKEYTFTTTQRNIQYNFANIAINQNGADSLLLNGVAIDTSSFTLIPNTSMLAGSIELNEGAHVISADIPFGLYIYGFGDWESYGYQGGLKLPRLGNTESLSIQWSNENPILGEELCFSVSSEAGTRLAVDSRVDFFVEGANTSAGHSFVASGEEVGHCYRAIAAGHDTITVIAGNYSQEFSITWNEVPGTGNSAPVILSAPVVDALVDIFYSYQLEVYDADPNSNLSFELINSPSGMAIDSIGRVTWSPTAADIGDYPVEISVTDDTGLADTQSYILKTYQGNRAPVIETAPSVSVAYIDHWYKDTITITDPDGDVPYCQIVGGNLLHQGGSDFDLCNLTTFLREEHLGEQYIEFKIHDRKGGEISYRHDVLVKKNHLPEIVPLPLSYAKVGQPYQNQLNVTDPDGDDLYFRITSATHLESNVRVNVSNITMDSATGEINWTPNNTQAGTYRFGVQIRDVIDTASTSFDVYVSPADQPFEAFLTLSNQFPAIDEPVTIKASTTGAVGNVIYQLTVNGDAVELNENNEAVYANTSIAGSYLAVLEVTDASGQTTTIQETFIVSDGSDITLPVADIISPEDAVRVTQPIDIEIIATDENISKWRLVLMSASNTEAMQEVASGNTNIEMQHVYRLDPSMLTNGLYLLQLEVTDGSGQVSYDGITLSVEGSLKVGNFTYTVEEFTYPLAGLPITVSRTYDSRRKHELLDFGYGWSLDYTGIKVEKSRGLGRAWALNEYKTGPLNLLTDYCVEPLGKIITTVTLPNDEVEKFLVKAEVPCYESVPNLDVNLTFEPVGDTDSTLILKSNPLVRLVDGNLQILGSGETFDANEFVLTTRAGFEYHFNTLSGMTFAKESNGATLTFNNSGIHHSSGKSVSISRSGVNNLVANIKTPDNRYYYFDQSANNNLIQRRTPLGGKESYTYDYKHGLLKILDSEDRTKVFNIYDDDGRLVAQEDGEGNRTSFVHDIEGKQSTVTDKRGNLTFYYYDEEGNVTSKVDALGYAHFYTYDENGNLLTETDPLSNVTTNVYNERNDLLSSTDALGNKSEYSYNIRGQELTLTDANGNAYTNTYDSVGNLLTITDPNENVAGNNINENGLPSMTQDALGNKTQFEYDEFGNKTKETDALGNVTTFTYNSANLVDTKTISRTLADGSVVQEKETYRYDAAGNVTQTHDGVAYQTSSFDKEGNKTYFSNTQHSIYYQYDVYGRLVEEKYSGDDASIQYAYDAEGNKISEIDRNGNETTFEYDALNRLVKTVHPDGTFARVIYDAAGRITAEIDENGNQIRFEYDAIGQRTKVIDALGNSATFTYDANGNLISETDALGRTTTYQYDVLNRKTFTTFHDNSVASSALDALGKQKGVTDQNGVTTQYQYDALGRLIKIIDAAAGETSYEYDEAGNKVAQTDALGRVTRWEYDARGLVKVRTLPEGQQELFTYDGSGNVLKHTNFNGQSMFYVYDNQGNLRSVRFTEGTETYAHDENGNRIYANSPSVGTFRYEYDSRNRLIKEMQPNGDVLAYEYDGVGNQTQLTVTFANGDVRIDQYSYDALNRLVSVTDHNNNTTSYGYDAVGNQTSVLYANNTSMVYEYDDLNRLTKLSHFNSEGALIESFDYTLDATGRRTQVIENDGRTTYYSYDSLYRLTQETITDAVNGDYNASYSYDSVGDRLTSIINGVERTYSYDNNDRVLTAGDSSFAYDENGNTLSETDGSTTKTYTYNAKNKLTDFTDGTNTTSYQYNVDGIRVNKTVNGATKHFIVDSQRDYAQVIAESNNDDQIVANFTYGLDLVSMAKDNESYFYLYDGLGSTKALSDSTENLTDTYDYEAFGELLNQTGSTENNYLFTGEQYDGELDNYYLRARYYDQGVGRFTQMDEWYGDVNTPITLNKYVYANSDAVNWTDPSGYFGIADIMAATRVQGTLNTITQIGTRFGSSATGRRLVWDGACFIVEELAEAAISHAIGLYVFDDVRVGKPYVGQSRSNIVDRLKAHFNVPRTYMKNVTHILPVSIAPGVTDKLTDVLDALEQSFIDELDGPGGRDEQSGGSANKRNQINFKNKQRKHLEVLMNKFKVCD